MGDPELRSDENILLRTPGVYVKSIPFEGILTNKRIILVDRATNLLPQKEIPLVTIKDIEAGENAIRDQIIKLSVLTRSGETRQMILTFSRQTGGNRIKERDAWLKVLKENTSSTFDQIIRKVIPGSDQPPKRPGRPASPRIEVISSPKVQNIPAAVKISGKKEPEGISPVKKIIEISPAPASPVSGKKGFETSSPQFGTYCSRCGNRVPDRSGYCNRCGSKILVPGSDAASTLTPADVPQLPDGEESANIQPIEKDIRTVEPLIEYSAEMLPSEPLWAVQQEPEPVAPLTESAQVASDEKFAKIGEMLDTARSIITDSRNSESLLPSDKPPVPQRPWHGLNVVPGKKAVIGIVAAIIIIAVVLGAFFLYPIISQGSGGTPGEGTSLTTLPTIVKNSGTVVSPSKTLRATGTATYPSGPGNSPARVGN